MHVTIDRPGVGHPNLADYDWTLPAFIVVLMAVGAIVSLFTGSVTPDVIGADGLSSSFMLGVP